MGIEAEVDKEQKTLFYKILQTFSPEPEILKPHTPQLKEPELRRL